MFSVNVDIMNSVSARASAIMTLFNFEAWTGGTSSLFITSALRTDSGVLPHAGLSLFLSLSISLQMSQSEWDELKCFTNWFKQLRKRLAYVVILIQKTSFSNSWADFGFSNEKKKKLIWVIYSRCGICFMWGMICRAHILVHRVKILSFIPCKVSQGPLPQLSHTDFSWKQDLRISSMSLLGINFFYYY